MSKKQNEVIALSLEAQALEILSSPQFFQLFLRALRREGVVGEEKNAIALYIVAISSLLDEPLNGILKASSSAGKNFIASRVLRFLPGDAVREITSSSDTALNYLGDLRHKVLYLQERNEANGKIHPLRLLISEQRIIRKVTIGGHVKDVVAEGPIASISTTTRSLLESDDESRHFSIRLDESAEQTKNINLSAVRRYQPNSDPGQEPPTAELPVWRQAYLLIKDRSARPVHLPTWFESVAESSNAENIVARRRFPALIQATRTVALIRSFETNRRWKPPHIEVEFQDYCVAAILFEDILVDSLPRGSEDDLLTAGAVEDISSESGGLGADAESLAQHLAISKDQAYRRLQRASNAGAIVRANKAEKANAKLYVRAPRLRFLPDPQTLLDQNLEIPSPVEFVNPLTGKLTRLQRKKETAAGLRIQAPWRGKVGSEKSLRKGTRR